VEVVGLGWDRLGFQLPWAGRRKRRHAVREALARVDATHLKHQLISSLSGGEKAGIAGILPRPPASIDDSR